MAEERKSKNPLFRDLGAQIDLAELETSEIESMCMRCHKNVRKGRGKTWIFSSSFSIGHLEDPANSGSYVSSVDCVLFQLSPLWGEQHSGSTRWTHPG